MGTVGQDTTYRGGQKYLGGTQDSGGDTEFGERCAPERGRLVTQLSELIQVRDRDKDGNNGAEREDEAEDCEFMRFFPSFVWVVRDFTLELCVGERPISEDEYLQQVLELKHGECWPPLGSLGRPSRAAAPAPTAACLPQGTAARCRTTMRRGSASATISPRGSASCCLRHWAQRSTGAWRSCPRPPWPHASSNRQPSSATMC